MVIKRKDMDNASQMVVRFVADSASLQNFPEKSVHSTSGG
jgi:hypothetical protein